MTVYGCVGKILRVNLGDEKVTREELREDVARKFLGGRGLGAKILFEELKSSVDPLSADNKLIFSTGPLTGAPFAGNSRYCVMAKSPLTGIWGEAHAAGYFGPELKYAGYDAVVFEGKADRPVYLWIRDEEVEIRKAEHLWGKITGEVQRAIREETKDHKTKVACIGPGGENLVRYASIVSDLHCAAGRSGMGAVMGSKKLKAVAVRGTRKVPVADEEKFEDLAKKAAKEVLENLFYKTAYNYGTSGGLEPLNASGRLPTKAFQKSTFEGAQKISGETMAKTILVGRATCPACPTCHYRVVAVKENAPYEVDPDYGGPEYETCAAFGSLLMNDNLVAIAKANELCNKYTLDTISTGISIAFAIECYEKGVISKKDTGGLDLSWGNYDAVIQLIHNIARREGIGDILADGVKKASAKIGGGSEKWALHVKGQELPMHEPRGKKGLGLSFATSPRGACHLQAMHDDDFADGQITPEIGIDESFKDVLGFSYVTYAGKEKAHLVKITEDLISLYDSLIVCFFTVHPCGISINTLVDLTRSVTGWDVEPKELMKVGERASNLCRVFNVREGITRKDDALPERLMEPLPEGPFKGETIPLDQMLNNYYEYRGWDEMGIPTKTTLRELGLEFAI